MSRTWLEAWQTERTIRQSMERECLDLKDEIVRLMAENRRLRSALGEPQAPHTQRKRVKAPCAKSLHFVRDRANLNVLDLEDKSTHKDCVEKLGETGLYPVVLFTQGTVKTVKSMDSMNTRDRNTFIRKLCAGKEVPASVSAFMKKPSQTVCK
jgi:hypothetical protein